MEKNLQQVPRDYGKYPLSKCNLSVLKEVTSNSVTLTNPIHIFQRTETANFPLKKNLSFRGGLSYCELHPV